METFWALLAICAGNSPVPGEFPTQRTVTRSFDVFFDLCLNKWLSKQWWGWWFETLSHPLWLHRIEIKRSKWHQRCLMAACIVALHQSRYAVGAYLAPGHRQPSGWCRPVSSYQGFLYLGPLLLTWINFNLSMPWKVWSEITCPFPNVNGYTVEVSNG